MRVDVFLNVAPHEPDFPLVDAGVGLFQRDLTLAQAFDLAPDQHDPALQRVEHGVVVAGLAVLGDCFFVLVVALFGRRFVLLLLSRGCASLENRKTYYSSPGSRCREANVLPCLAVTKLNKVFLGRYYVQLTKAVVEGQTCFQEPASLLRYRVLLPVFLALGTSTEQR